MKHISILTIGNSFSDDTVEHLWQILKDLGYEDIVLGNLYIGGCSVNMHLNNAVNDLPVYWYRTNTDGTWNTTPGIRMRQALEERKWDCISMQPGTHDGSRNTDLGSFARLPRLIAYVKALAPEARLVWNLTWTGEPGCTHPDYLLYDCDGERQYRDMMTVVKAAVLSCPEIRTVAPTGTAVANARAAGYSMCRDYYHLTMGFGRYLAGLTFAGALTGESIARVSFAPEDVDATMQAAAKKAAADALRHPYQVTAPQEA